MTKFRCTFCRTYFDGPVTQRVGISSYCSDYCLQASARKPRKNSPPKRVRARSGVTADVRKAVFAADGNSCRYCGQQTHDLSVHHVYYRSEANHQPWVHQRQNLLTLCTECHNLVHSNKKRFQPLALGVVWLRETEGNEWCTIPMLERQLQQEKEMAYGKDNEG